MKPSYRLFFMYVAMICIIIMQYTPLHIPFITAFPDILLLYMVYTSSYFSGKLFIISSILIGILNDMIAGNIIGITSIKYAIIMVALQSTSKYFNNKSFSIIWIRSTALMLLVNIVGILIYHYKYSLWITDIKMLLNNVVTVFSYPTAHVIFSKFLKVEAKVVDAG